MPIFPNRHCRTVTAVSPKKYPLSEVSRTFLYEAEYILTVILSAGLEISKPTLKSPFKLYGFGYAISFCMAIFSPGKAVGVTVAVPVGKGVGVNVTVGLGVAVAVIVAVSVTVRVKLGVEPGV